MKQLVPSLMVLAVAPPELAFVFLAAGWATMSFANVVYNTSTVSLRQAYVPQRDPGTPVSLTSPGAGSSAGGGRGVSRP